MLTMPRERFTIDRLQELLEDVFQARDELYVAADHLVDEDQVYICRWLGERLGGHAADLEQVINANGSLVEPPAEDFTDQMYASASSDRTVLSIAERAEHDLTRKYDSAIQHLADQEVVGLLHRQRAEVEFADRVLRSLTR